ncbi:unnamed protein product [Vitrella brassicaformis CCMP3155]|uniref:DUF881 domain-containing protein n=1 Tax=Vitrella brassicaformis (strain CCMP3155) TaxID=1169540 RepID=A0A0G4G7I0_VITBC|nr:unnamed protein product [Vitrella brassicaformis CCMP3155]|eukprot:CEM24591.1 unnamed protein product [Vitrella brassicaformis CCMP3155]
MDRTSIALVLLPTALAAVFFLQVNHLQTSIDRMEKRLLALTHEQQAVTVRRRMQDDESVSFDDLRDESGELPENVTAGLEEVQRTCPELYERIEQAAARGEKFAPDRVGILRAVGDEVVRTAEYLDEISIFKVLDADLSNVQKVETIYLHWGNETGGNNLTYERVYRIQNVNRFIDEKGQPTAEVFFVGGDRLVLIPEGANLFSADDLESPIAVFAGPEFSDTILEEYETAVDTSADSVEEQEEVADDSGKRRLSAPRRQLGIGVRVGPVGVAVGRPYYRPRPAARVARATTPLRVGYGYRRF